MGSGSVPRSFSFIRPEAGRNGPEIFQVQVQDDKVGKYKSCIIMHILPCIPGEAIKTANPLSLPPREEYCAVQLLI